MVKNEIKRPKVAIIDDDEDLLKIMIYGFHSEGFEVDTFKNGKEALEALLNANYIKEVDLLIIDRLLPDIDGIDILREISKQEYEKIPLIIILSILSTDTEVIKGLELGAVDYLSKPFKLHILIDKAKSLIARYKK